MPALESGIRAPRIDLAFLDGKKFSLEDALRRGPVVAAFFKVNCPVCQFTFPYLERVFQTYGASSAFTLIGISQNDAADTRSFNREYGVTFPTLLDEKGKYPVSNAYGLTNVPTIFVISSAGEVESSSVGWSRRDVEQLSQRLARLSGKDAIPLFAPGEKIPDYKPG
ncbi:MAG TPA: TlpA disulfide reductase family protein [Terriglobales bacterium]